MADLPQPLDPGMTPQWLDAQRQQQLAQMLMGSLQQANQTPDNWNSMKVVPRRGMLQNVSVLANALLAGKAQKDAQQSTAQYYQKLYAPDPSQQPMDQQSQDSGQTFSGPTGDISVPGQQKPPAGNLPQLSDQVTWPHNPMILPGMSHAQAQMMHDQLGSQKYAEMLMGTPEWQTALRINGGNVPAAMAQLQAEARVKGTMHMRQGEDIVLPNGQTIRNPVLGPGETLSRDAQGNPQQVSLIPGATDSAGAMKGATVAAEVANTPRMIPMGGGSERLMYPGDPGGPGAPPALRASPSAQGPSINPPGQSPQRNAPQATPAQRSQQQPNPPAPSGIALPQKDASGILTNNLWSDIPKMVVPSSPGQTSNDYQKAVTTSAAKKHQELVDKFGDQSAAGVQQLEYLTEAEKALPKAEVGPMTEYLTHNRGLLIQAFPSLAGALGGEKVTPTLELNKQLTNAALQGARTTFGSRMTQNEVKLQTEEMSPSVEMTHDALVSLIHQAKMKAAYGIQQDKDYGDYHAQNGDPNRFESQYNVRRPITRFAAQYNTPSNALDRLKQNPALLADFKTKYGWDPTR
jgi:hypothetical protein